MITWRPAPELKTLVEDAVEAVLKKPALGLKVVVDQVLAEAEPPRRVLIRSTLHFQDKGSPYCCGEPTCHLGIRFKERVTEQVRSALNLQPATVEFEDIEAAYDTGDRFKHAP